MELVYDYLDADVAKWLRENAPEARKGQNYHQWLSSQYGLKRLTEHIWMVIGMAATCQSLPELRQRLAERFGKHPVQFTLFMDPPSSGGSSIAVLRSVTEHAASEESGAMELPGAKAA
jgi:hypothetical protein